MLVVAAIWSVTSVVDKLCVVRSSPVFYLAAFHLGFVAGYLPLAPDLVAEVISPGDSFTEVEEKSLSWLAAGTALVLLVDPGTRTVLVHRSATTTMVLYQSGRVCAPALVPGGRLA